MGATVGMYGDLQGIAGKSLQEIEGLELPALEAPCCELPVSVQPIPPTDHEPSAFLLPRPHVILSNAKDLLSPQ